ncbi:hypothetical protein pb186bvf_017582 [Paramecium bursaria]
MDYMDIADIANQLRESGDTEGLKEIYEGNIDVVEQTEFLRKDYVRFLFEIQDFEKGVLWLQKCLSLTPNDPELINISKQLQRQAPNEEEDDDDINYQPQQNFNQNKTPQQPQMANPPNAQKPFMNQGLNPMGLMGMKDMSLQQPQNIRDQMAPQEQIKKIEKPQQQQKQQLDIDEMTFAAKHQLEQSELTFGQKQQNQPEKQNQKQKQQDQPEEPNQKPLLQETEKNYDEKFNDTVKKYGQACQFIITDIKKTLQQFQEIQLYLNKKFHSFTKREEIETVIQYVLSNERILQILGPQNEKESQAIWIVQERNKIYEKIAELTPFDDNMASSLEQLYKSIVSYATNKLKPEKFKLYQEALTVYTINFFDFFANHQFLQSIQAYELKDIGNFSTDYEEQLKLQQVYIKLFANNSEVFYIFLQQLQKLINNLDQRIEYLTKLSAEQLDNLKAQSRILKTTYEQLEQENQLPEIIVAIQDSCILVFNCQQYTDELLEAQDVCLYLAQKINDQYNIVI